MSLREEQCKKVCRILDDVLANRPTERDSLIVATRNAFSALSDPNWIPVTERLPQTGESVMICDAYGDICIGHRTMGGYYFPDFCEDKIKDVRAWCELPEPFKEVTE
jgi:hypothetical protein